MNHKYNFVDLETGAHTQQIERTWRDPETAIPTYSQKEDGYIVEYLFKVTLF